MLRFHALCFGLVAVLLAAGVSQAMPAGRLADSVRFKALERAASDAEVEFTVAIKQPTSGVAALSALVSRISDPLSPEYGQYRTQEEVRELVRPEQHHVDAVLRWLQEAGVEGDQISYTSGDDSLSFRSTVDVASRALDVSFYVFRDQHEGVPTIKHVRNCADAGRTDLELSSSGDELHASLTTACESGVSMSGSAPVRLPPSWDSEAVATLREAVQFVEGLSSFPSRRNRPSRHRARDGMSDQEFVAVRRRVEAGDPADAHFTGQVSGKVFRGPDVRALYGIPEDFTVTTAVDQSAAAFKGSPALACDAGANSKFYGSDTFNYPPITTIPANTPGCFDDFEECQDIINAQVQKLETCLDVQYISAIGRGAATVWWTTSKWMYSHAVEIFNRGSPLVHSFSYGWPSSDQCSIGTCGTFEGDEGYVDRTNTEFQKIAAISITLLASSGDDGASAGDCGNGVLSDFPAASPFITAVGATMLTSGGEEVACSAQQSLITTGGGFASYGAMPDFQRDLVHTYLQRDDISLPPANLFNSSKRAYPDISAIGHNLYSCSSLGCDALSQCTSVFDGVECTACGLTQCQPVDGTSASAPIVAGLVTLLNGWLKERQLPVLGYLNPLLYRMATDTYSTTFGDITKGDNRCGRKQVSQFGVQPADCCDYGWDATVGWDAATGLGVPNFPGMLKYLCALHAFNSPLNPPTPQLTGSANATSTTIPRTQRQFTVTAHQLPTDATKFVEAKLIFSSSRIADIDLTVSSYDATSGQLVVTMPTDVAEIPCGCSVTLGVSVCGNQATTALGGLSCCDKPSGSPSIAIIAGAAIGGVVVVFAVVFFVRRRRRARDEPLLGGYTQAGDDPMFGQ